MPEFPTFSSNPTKILLPLDFSPSWQPTMEMAFSLAQPFHAELSLVNVIPLIPATTAPDMIPEEPKSPLNLWLAK